MRPIKVVIFESDCVVKYSGGNDFSDIPIGGKSDIELFTRESRRRLAFVASNTHVRFAVMVTLTYPKNYPSNGLQVKKHFKLFKDSLLRKHPASYLWCLEFQKRGAPHYHILLDNLEVMQSKAWVSSRWFAVVDSKDDKHLAAGTRVEKMRSADGGKRYLVKYAAKMRQKKVPDGYANVGRFWGHSRNVKPSPIAEIDLNTGYNALRKLLASWDRLDSAKLPLRVLYNASEGVLNVANNA